MHGSLEAVPMVFLTTNPCQPTGFSQNSGWCSASTSVPSEWPAVHLPNSFQPLQWRHSLSWKSPTHFSYFLNLIISLHVNALRSYFCHPPGISPPLLAGCRCNTNPADVCPIQYPEIVEFLVKITDSSFSGKNELLPLQPGFGRLRQVLQPLRHRPTTRTCAPARSAGSERRQGLRPVPGAVQAPGQVLLAMWPPFCPRCRHCGGPCTSGTSPAV